MKIPRKAQLLHLISRAGFVMKGIDGVLECAGAFILLAVPPRALNWVVRILTEHELSRDPSDFLATHLVKWAHEWSLRPKVFFSIYLMIHGGVKIFLVIGLLRRKLWAYPVALVFMLLLIFYQIYRYSHTHSHALAVFTVLDCLVTFFIAMDYQYVKRRSA